MRNPPIVMLCTHWVTAALYVVFYALLSPLHECSGVLAVPTGADQPAVESWPLQASNGFAENENKTELTKRSLENDIFLALYSRGDYMDEQKRLAAGYEGFHWGILFTPKDGRRGFVSTIFHAVNQHPDQGEKDEKLFVFLAEKKDPMIQERLLTRIRLGSSTVDLSEVEAVLRTVPVPNKYVDPSQSCVTWALCGMEKMQENGWIEKFDIPRFGADAFEYAQARFHIIRRTPLRDWKKAREVIARFDAKEFKVVQESEPPTLADVNPNYTPITVREGVLKSGKGASAEAFFFKGDNRKPYRIFKDGIAPKGSNLNIEDHLFPERGGGSGFVTLSRSLTVARHATRHMPINEETKTRYVYLITPETNVPDGYWMPEIEWKTSMDKNMLDKMAKDLEFAAGGDIPAQAVAGVYEKPVGQKKWTWKRNEGADTKIENGPEVKRLWCLGRKRDTDCDFDDATEPDINAEEPGVDAAEPEANAERPAGVDTAGSNAATNEVSLVEGEVKPQIESFAEREFGVLAKKYGLGRISAAFKKRISFSSIRARIKGYKPFDVRAFKGTAGKGLLPSNALGRLGLAAGIGFWVSGIVEAHTTTTTAWDKAAAWTAIVPIVGCSVRASANAAQGKHSTGDTTACVIADVAVLTPGLLPVGFIIHAVRGIINSFSDPTVMRITFVENAQQVYDEYVRLWNLRRDAILKAATSQKFLDNVGHQLELKKTMIIFSAARKSDGLRNMTLEAAKSDKERKWIAKGSQYAGSRALHLSTCVQLQRTKQQMEEEIMRQIKSQLRSQYGEFHLWFERRYLVYASQWLRYPTQPKPGDILIKVYKKHWMRGQKYLKPGPYGENEDSTLGPVREGIRRVLYSVPEEDCSYCEHQGTTCQWRNCGGEGGGDKEDLQLGGMKLAAQFINREDMASSVSEQCSQQLDSCARRLTWEDGKFGHHTPRELWCVDGEAAAGNEAKEAQVDFTEQKTLDPAEPQVKICDGDNFEGSCVELATPFGQCVQLPEYYRESASSLELGSAVGSCDFFQAPDCKTADDWMNDQLSTHWPVNSLSDSNPEFENSIQSVLCHSPTIDICKDAGRKECKDVAAPLNKCVNMPREFNDAIGSMNMGVDKGCEFYTGADIVENLRMQQRMHSFDSRISSYKCLRKRRVTVCQNEDSLRCSYIQNGLVCTDISLENQGGGLSVRIHDADVTCRLFTRPGCGGHEKDVGGRRYVTSEDGGGFKSIICGLVAPPEIITVGFSSPQLPDPESGGWGVIMVAR